MSTTPPKALADAFKLLITQWKWLYGALPNVRAPKVMPRIGVVQLTAAAQLLEEALQQGTTPPPPGPPDPGSTVVDTITVSPASVPALAVGATQALTPTLKNAAGVVLTGVSVTYDVADDSVASVTPQGVLTGSAIGDTTVLVQSGVKTATVQLSVVAPPPDTTPDTITIAPTSLTMTVGGSDATFVATVKNAASVVIGGSPVVWSSGDPTKLTIGANTGIAHAVAAGSVTIVARATNGITNTASVTVNADTTPSTVTVSPPTISLTVGGSTGQLTAVVKNAAGAVLSGASVTWGSGSPSFATVNSATGVVTAVSAGTSTITATAGSASGTASAVVAASATTPNAVDTQPPSASLTIGGTDLTLVSTVTNASSQTIPGAVVTYVSSAPTVATVGSTSGIVHALAVGTTTITASTTNGHTDTVAITVQADVTPATVTVTPPTLTGIAGGATQQLSATVKNAAGTVVNATVAWSSSAPSIATVNAATGVVTFLAQGTATITATAGTKTGTSAVTVQASNPNPPPTGYSIASPHYSHKDEQWTDFGYQYRDGTDPAVQVEINTKASRIDQVMGGNVGRSRWSANPGMKWGPYVLIWKPLIPGLNGATGASQPSAWAGSSTSPASDMKTWADARGFSVEDGLLHYRDGQIKFETTKAITNIAAGTPAVLTVPSHGFTTGQRMATSGMSAAASGLVSTVYPAGAGQMIVIDANTISIPSTATATITTGAMGSVSNQIGDGSNTFVNRKIVRVGTFGVRWETNPKTAWVGDYHAFRLTPSFANADFVFVDESDQSQFTSINGAPNINIDSLEYNMAGLTSPQQDALRQTHYNDINTVQAKIRAANGGKPMQANTASYYTALDRQMAKGAGGAQHEQSPNLTNGIDSYGTYLSFALQCVSDGSIICMVDPYSYDDITNNTNTGTNTQSSGSLNGMTASGWSSPVMRFKGTYYALYLLARPAQNGIFYYDDNSSQWTEPQTVKFQKVSEALLGLPTASRTSVNVATTDTGPVALTDKIASRTYSNGWVVVRLANDRLALHYGDTPAYTVTLPTDATYYRANDDGTVASTPSTTVVLNRLDSAIFVKQPGGAAPPPDTTTLTVSVTPSSASLTVPNTVTLTSTSKNAAGTILTGKTPVWSSGTPAVATVNSSTGVVTAVSAGTSVITSTEGGHTGTSTITCSVSNALAGFPNATSGGSLAGCRDFSTKAANTTDTGTGVDTGSGKSGGSQGWGADTEYNNTHFTIGTDATAPNTPSSIGGFTFSAGSTGDTPIGFGYASAPSGSWRRIYYGADVKVDTTFPAGINLQIARFLFGSRTLALWFNSAPGGALTAKLYGEVITDPTLHGTYFAQNIDASKTFTKGLWNRVELEILTNTKGLSDGTAKLWMGPTLITSITGLQIDSSTTSQNLFTQHQTRPRATFGSALGADAGISFDHVYAVVKSS